MNDELVDSFEELLDDYNFRLNIENEFDGDIHSNAEEHTKVLRLETMSFCPGLTGAILGMKLQEVCVTATGQGFRYQKLVLKFVPMHVGLKQCSSESVIIDINDICNVKILDWYHPCYPNFVVQC